MDKSLFHIIQNDLDKGRNFQIHPTQSKDVGNGWLIQPDDNSCGYYLIHNAHQYIQIPDYEGSPDAVFSAINVLRNKIDEEELPLGSKLTSPDMSRYFNNKGFDVEELSIPLFSKSRIDRIFSERDFDLIYLTSNRHYTGIVKNQDELLYLNPMSSAPYVINAEDACRKIIGSIGPEESGQINIVGIVKKQNIKFRINN